MNDFEIVTVEIYVEDELAASKNYAVNENKDMLCWAVKRGIDEIIISTDFKKFPTMGMKLVNGVFIDGDNGETFREYVVKQNIKNSSTPSIEWGGMIGMGAEGYIFLNNKKVVGVEILYNNSEYCPQCIPVIAALKSNPRFVLIDEKGLINV